MQMIIDSHIHFGQYYANYTTPTALLSFLDSVGVTRFAVSSTTTCEEDHNKVIEEFKELLSIAGDRCIPVLWITPAMISSWAVFSMFDKGIKWKCLKIHPQLHPTEWLEGSTYLRFVVSIAAVFDMPLLIHTGETTGCSPKLFEWIINVRPDVTFILAHGRPISQTIEMMKQYPNVWCDTAFMPTEEIVRLCNEGLSARVLWGSDYPITQYYYPHLGMNNYYQDLLQRLKDSVSQMDFHRITQLNFTKLFG